MGGRGTAGDGAARRTTGRAGDVPIVNLLDELGVPLQHRSVVRRSLETAGLTTPRKARIARLKGPAVGQHVHQQFAFRCPPCAAASPPDGPHVLPTSHQDCHGCHGSGDVRAVHAMVSVLRASGFGGLVVVGGSPGFRRHLHDMVGDGFPLRTVDGTARHTDRAARANIAWADVIAIMGSSELAHRVSNLYTSDVPARRRTVTVPRRSLTALAGSVSEHVRQRTTAR